MARWKEGEGNLLVAAQSIQALLHHGPEVQSMAGAIHLASALDTLKAIAKSLGIK